MSGSRFHLANVSTLSIWCSALLVSLASAVAHGNETDEAATTSGPFKIPLEETAAIETAKLDDTLPAFDWSSLTPDRSGEIHSQIVTSGPHVLEADAMEALDNELKIETDAYLAWLLDSEEAPRVLDLDLDYIKSHLLKAGAPHHEAREYSVGLMHSLSTQLKFDTSFRNDMKARWKASMTQSRMYLIAICGGGLLLVLTSLYSYFRLDAATRGFYSGRLQFLTVTAILVFVIAGVATARWTGLEWLW